MKIVCGNCGAKYSISDDKVQGKVFKIRCRKCSNVIVVKGTQDEEGSSVEAGAGQNYDGFGGGASASEWYVVIDGEQAGPLSPEEVEAYHASGRITTETFIWRDGMQDWKTLSDVDVFAHLAAYDDGFGADDATQIAQSPLLSQGAAEHQEDPTAVVDTSSLHDDLAGSMADPYADNYDDPTEAGGSFNEAALAQAPYDQGGYEQSNGYDQGGGYGGFDEGAIDHGGGGGGFDDFGQDAGMAAAGVGIGGYDQPGAGMSQYDEGGSDQADGMFASFDSQPSGGDQGLAYQSFSGLDSAGADLNLGGGGGGLDMNGVGSGEPVGGGAANDMIGQRNENSVLFSLSSLQQVEAVSAPDEGGGSVTEGSGLIDIQALASSHAAMKSSAADDVLGGASPETFSPGTMAVPAIMPQGSHRSNKGLMIGIGAMLFLVLVGMGGIVYWISTQEDKPAEPAKVIVQKETIIKEVTKEPSGDEAAAAAKAALADAQGAKDAPPAEAGDEGVKSSGKSTRKGTAKKPESGSKSDSPSKVIPKKNTKPRKTLTKKGSGIDDILGDLDNKKKTESKKKTPSASASKKKRTKTDITSTFKKYAGRFKSCPNSGGLKAPVFVRMKIAPAGKVTKATIDSKSSKFKGTDIGACAVKVARSMKFPAAQDDDTFAFPVRF